MSLRASSKRSSGSTGLIETGGLVHLANSLHLQHVGRLFNRRYSLIAAPMLAALIVELGRWFLPDAVLSMFAYVFYWPPVSAGIEWVAFVTVNVAAVVNQIILRRADRRESLLVISGRNGVNSQMSDRDIEQAEYRNGVIGWIAMQALMFLLLPNNIDARAMGLKVATLAVGALMLVKAVRYYRTSVEINAAMDARERRATV